MRGLFKILIYTFAFILISFIGIATWVYQTEDSIGRANYDTYFKLYSFLLGVHNAQETTDWLLKDHGAAPSMQVMIVLTSFSTSHPETFRKLLRSIPKNQRALVLDEVEFTIRHPDSMERFQRAFGQPLDIFKNQLLEQ